VIEVLIRPVDMSELCRDGKCRRTGDCDDYSMYTAALLKAAQVDVKFATVKADPRQPDRDSHVYVVAYNKDRGRVALDVSHGLYPGWEVEAQSKTEWDIGASPLWLVAAAALVIYLLLRRGRA
jgi:transglutaminase-like putative cysteine protease